jgi:hypothetical protein
MKNKGVARSILRISITVLSVILVVLVISEVSLITLKPCEKVDNGLCAQTLTCEFKHHPTYPKQCIPDESGKIDIGDCLVLSSTSQAPLSCQQESFGVTKLLWRSIVK